MPHQVRVLVLRTAGTNCNEETAFAFECFGAHVQQVHVNELVAAPKSLHDYHILALPGGFSYGDDIASGRILANELRLKLGEDIKKFIADGKLIIGICNGFQILVKAGILPGLGLTSSTLSNSWQEATLFHNDSGKFESRWTHLKVSGKSIWTKDLPQRIYLPVAHGEGKFIPLNQDVYQTMKLNHHIVFSYCTPEGSDPIYPQNPNGSYEHIAGICDTTGRVLGLMPHPERHVLFEQHPQWSRLPYSDGGKVHTIGSSGGKHQIRLGEGARIFENGVHWAKVHL